MCSLHWDLCFHDNEQIQLSKSFELSKAKQTLLDGEDSSVTEISNRPQSRTYSTCTFQSRDQEKSANREPNVCLLSPNYYFDERLAVIAEVDEKDHQSEASNFESNNSINQRLENEKRKFSTDSGTELSAVVAAVQKNSLLYQKGVRYLELS